MKNTLESYYQIGASAAKAINRKDQSLYNRQHTLFLRARCLENDTDKKAAEDQYDSGYRETINRPTPAVFN